MTRLTTTFISHLNKMTKAAKDALLGTRLDDIEYRGVATPAVGTITPMSVLRYETAPALGTAVATHAAIAMTSGAQTITTGITNPDVPRIVSVKGNASGITGNVVITGTNIAGATVTDTIALNGSTEVLGVIAFKTVTSIALPAETHAGTDTVSVGRGDKIGFPVAIPNASRCFSKSFNGTVDAGTVTPAATIGGSIYAPAGTLDGTKVVSLVFVA